MTLRSTLLAALVAVPVCFGSAAAQTDRSAPALVNPESAPALSEAPSSAVAVACTPGVQAGNTAAATSAFTSQAASFQVGQSFVAPCDGTLTSLLLVMQNSTTSVPGAFTLGTLRVYNGSGTAGTVVATQAFRIANPAAAPAGTFGAGFYPLRIAAPMVQGQTYTFFVNVTSGGHAIQGSTANPYASGTLYASSTGSAATATADATSDLTFVATFDAPTVAQPSVFNGPGWRLLSPPVGNVPVQELAQVNLVQGYTSQYPTAGENLFVNYTGTGTAAGFDSRSTITPSITPDAAFFSLATGRGFFWYLYDQNLPTDTTSFGGGSSFSRELTGFTFSATGSTPTAAFLRTMPQLNADGLYMLGNPFARPLAVSGITRNSAATFGTLGSTFFTYDPAISNYRSLFVVNPVSGVSDYVAVWQGLFGQLTGVTATTAPQFRYDYALTSTTAPAPFYGRGASSVTPYVQLMLDGTTAAGTEVHDVTAYVRFTADGLATWDADDALKPVLPPGGESALIAPVGVNAAGNRARLAVMSFPATTTGTTLIPVDFSATAVGTYTVSWAGVNALPAGWAATLYDAVRDQTVNLSSETSYTFTSAATGWTERFTLALSRGATAGEAAPAALRVGTFAPNPAAGLSRLTFTSDVAQTVRATVVDALGREVVVLFDAAVTAGAETSLSVEAGRLAPGTYAVRIAGETFTETRRLTVVR